MLPSFITIVAGIFLSVNMATAQDSGGLSSQQSCLLNCSLAAVTASGCDIQNTTCVCASTVYVTNLTQCATSSCSFSASDIKGFLNSGCPNGSASATPPNSAEFNGARTGAAAASAIGLIFYALLV
ncbi:hypothetical protein B0H13DRAFT_2306264 [Mycena leptocephala]|nr:hypothetical protein B0H13DRAFT_2306264 [Mycena leptocephala]